MQDDFRAFLIVRNDNDAIAGVVNMSQIFRGPFQTAYLGFYAMQGEEGQGLVREGLRLVLGIAFREMRLHRLEANIQPENARSSCLGTIAWFSQGRVLSSLPENCRTLARP
jgi:ribosomal-protein-alanine N-acetyltransferase